jgi:DMSO/TMAO reductase YedYZ molybdopterin-dependent catalytic subunit
MPDVMLAWEMDGSRYCASTVRRCGRDPEMYGYKNVKWVAEINLVPQPELGYWRRTSATTRTPGSAARTATHRGRDLRSGPSGIRNSGAPEIAISGALRAVWS